MLVEATEQTILLLFDDFLDWPFLIYQLETFAEQRGFHKGMQGHHIEPERDRVVFLWPLEHLAIHICHAKLKPSNSNNAKVTAFVKPYPGCYNVLVSLQENLYNKVLSLGQSRPNTSNASIKHARSFIDKEKQREAVRLAGRKHKGRECTWSDKVSETIFNSPLITCDKCGKVMKNIGGNLKQHQRSTKCQS